MINVTSRLGCVGEPNGANFPMKYMALLVAFDRSPLPHVAKFSNHLHTGVRFQNPPTHWSLLEPHGTKCVGGVRRETELLSVHNWRRVSTCGA